MSLGYLCFNNLQLKATSLQTLIKIISYFIRKKRVYIGGSESN